MKDTIQIHLEFGSQTMPGTEQKPYWVAKISGAPLVRITIAGKSSKTIRVTDRITEAEAEELSCLHHVTVVPLKKD